MINVIIRDICAFRGFRFFRTVVPAITLACLMAPAVPSHAAPPPGYKLVWSDEFNQGVGSGPNPADWHIQNSKSNPNNELENYVTDTAHCGIVADPDATDGQALQIEATHTSDYESAKIDTNGRQAFQYGYAEARIKMPYGQGIWPAFWMLGTNADEVGWPACGEIDIMENIGNTAWYGKSAGTLHGITSADADFTDQGIYQLPAGQTFHDGYHLFQMLWERNKIAFYVDNQLYKTTTANDLKGDIWPFNAPEYFILNLAIGGYWPGSPDNTTQFPQDMRIDYIRFYEIPAKLQPAPRRLAAAPGRDGATVVLSWKANDKATSYTLYRGTDPGVNNQPVYLKGLTEPEFVDRGLFTPEKFYYQVAAVNNAGTSPASSAVSATPNPPDEEAYSGTPPVLPGTIRISDFDKGGDEIGYYSMDLNRSGGAYRPNDAIGMEACKDVGGGWDVGWAQAGQWLRYTVNVSAAGAYTVAFRVSSGATGGTFHLEDASGNNLTGTVTVPGTGDWQKWATVTAAVTLPAGRQVLKLVEDSDGYNLASMTFTSK